MYTKVTENANSREQYFVDISAEDGVSIILPNTGKATLDAEGFVNLLNYLGKYDYTLALQEKGFYYKKANAPLGYYATVDDTIVAVDITLSSGKIPDVSFKTISTENGKILSEVGLNATIFGKVITLAGQAGLKATVTPISKIEFVDKLPAETSAKRETVYLNQGKYYVLNVAEDALVEITGTIVAATEFPATEAPAKEGILYNLTDEMQVGNIRYKRGLYTYNATTNEYALQEETVTKVDKLPDIAKAKKNVIYLLTKDMKDDEGKVTKASGTAWKVSNNAYAEETRRIVNTGKLEIKEIAAEGTNYIVNGVLYTYAKSTKKFNKVGKVVKANTLPDVTKIQLSNDVVYTLTDTDGSRAKGSRWVFNTTDKEFEEYTD